MIKETNSNQDTILNEENQKVTYCSNLIRIKILHDLSATAYIVYLTILSKRKDNEIYSKITVPNIAKECNLSKRAVEENITKLFDSKYLIINSGDLSNSNIYYFPQEEFHKGHENDIEVLTAKRRKGVNKKSKTNFRI